MGSEMRMSVFFIKKSIFSKFLKLWGNVSYCIRTGFEVLFQPLNDFQPTFTVFEKNPFFDEKNAFFGKGWLMSSKMRMNVFFYQKIDFFSKTMRVGSKSFRGWNKTPKPFRIRWETVAESFSNFEKIDFLWKKTLILISDPIRHSLPNVHFFIKKSIFFKDDEGRFKII